MRVLVVEDEKRLAQNVADGLRQCAGYAVDVAADGNAGLAAATLAPPALVITDIRMPGVNGGAIISELKRRHPQVPVIAISGLFTSGRGLDAEAAIALGAARALAKPFRRAELLRAVAELLGRPYP